MIKNDFYYYESNFNEDSLKQKFNNSDIQVIYNSINELINKNEIKIEKNKKILTEEEKENLYNENKKEIENKEYYSISILFNKYLRKLTLISICILTIVSFLLYGVLLISTLTKHIILLNQIKQSQKKF